MMLPDRWWETPIHHAGGVYGMIGGPLEKRPAWIDTMIWAVIAAVAIELFDWLDLDGAIWHWLTGWL